MKSPSRPIQNKGKCTDKSKSLASDQELNTTWYFNQVPAPKYISAAPVVYIIASLGASFSPFIHSSTGTDPLSHSIDQSE